MAARAVPRPGRFFATMASAVNIRTLGAVAKKIPPPLFGGAEFSVIVTFSVRSTPLFSMPPPCASVLFLATVTFDSCASPALVIPPPPHA